MPLPRAEQPLQFESRISPTGRFPKQGAYAILGAVAAWIIAFWKGEVLDASSLVGLVIALAVFGALEVMASRTRTIISIRNGFVVVQTGSMVTGSFALSDIAEFEPTTALPDNVLSTPVEVSKVVTRSNLVFYIPTSSLCSGDRQQLIDLLATHASAPKAAISCGTIF